MRENCTSGSARGASGNRGSYRKRVTSGYSAMSKLQDEHLEFFFEISIDLMCIAGVDGYFKRVNPAFTKALGWTAEELLAKPFIEFVHPADRERTGNEVRRLASGIDTVYFENRYLKKDGSWAWLGLDLPGGNAGKRAVIRSCPRYLGAKENSRAFGPTRHLR